MTIYGNTTHPLHHHGLKLEREETPYVCNGCGEVGFYTRYACKEGCNFHLHKDCASPKDVITHPFFPRCQFHFLLQSPPSGRGRYCDACGRDIKGFVYHCFEKGWDLHPCCEALARETVVGPEEAKATLVHRVPSSKCVWCGKKELENGVNTWTYVFARKEYSHLHVACSKEMLLEKWEMEHLGHGKVVAKAGRKVDTLAVKAGRTDSLALEISEPSSQIVPQKKKSKRGKFAKFKKIVQIAITFIMAAVVGDPTALVAGLIASLIAH